jgi:heat-inducible transcriptional repressor
MEARLLSPRTGTILRSIVNWYIDHAVPVSSQVLVHDYDLGVSSATVRNEMAFLEQEGYIFRPHTSAGSVPSDKGYRFYVGSLEECTLPLSEQRMISHLFHQVEGRMDEWLSLGATIISRLSQNTAVITVPRHSDSQFRHIELVSIQDNLVLLVLVLRGARIKQQLMTMDHPVTQPELSAISGKFNPVFVDLTCDQIINQTLGWTALEQQMLTNVIKLMRQEDEQGFNQSYLEGLHFMLNQPEFSHNQRTLAVMELLEHRTLLGTILPVLQENGEVMVVIGSENKAEVAHDCSLVISRYGLTNEASGTIMVVGPTRMPYSRVISSVSYLSVLLSHLVAELYGVNTFSENERESSN